MFADSTAMAIDLFTFLFNFFAEKKKSDLDISTQKIEELASTLSTTKTISQTHHEQILSNQRLKLILELLPPLFSATVLIIVNTYILQDAIYTLIVGDNGEDDEDIPDVFIMFIFAVLKLILKCISNHNKNYKKS